ncbi:putative ATPase, V0 complex, subunit e1/e2 [Helianthus debilis subsp. tardiflorus]
MLFDYHESLWCSFHLTLVITATICCWLMWAIVYLAQMNPLIVPILSEGE